MHFRDRLRMATQSKLEMEGIGMNARKADFSGTWYPGTESECLRAIQAFSSDTASCIDLGTVVGGIVPHAGWYFSGQIAFNVIACIGKTHAPETWILFGRHLHASDPFYIMKKGKWSTPLGALSIDEELAERVSAAYPFKVETETRCSQDNTIELQLPFLKYFSPDSMILPVGVPPSPDCIGVGVSVVEAAKNLGRTVKVLGSTDLTHYGYNYGYAPKGDGQDAVDWVVKENDRRMVELIVAMDGKGVLTEAALNRNACCAGAVAAAVSAAGSLGAVKGREILYGTSYDKHKDSNLVGYVGVVFHL
jgi:MEMO1 family protein